MTEIEDLPAFLGMQQAPRLTDAQREHMEAVQEFERREMLDRIRAVQFFAPILCACNPRFEWYAGHPPQVECPIHSVLMAHPYTGQPIWPGMPLDAVPFTPGRAESQPAERNDDDDEHRAARVDRGAA